MGIMSKGKGIVAAAAVMGVSVAHAELPAAIGTALTQVSTDATAMFALGWPVFATIAGGFVLFKLAKRVLGKVT